MITSLVVIFAFSNLFCFLLKFEEIKFDTPVSFQLAAALPQGSRK